MCYPRRSFGPRKKSVKVFNSVKSTEETKILTWLRNPDLEEIFTWCSVFVGYHITVRTSLSVGRWTPHTIRRFPHKFWVGAQRAESEQESKVWQNALKAEKVSGHHVLLIELGRYIHLLWSTDTPPGQSEWIKIREQRGVYPTGFL